MLNRDKIIATAAELIEEIGLKNIALNKLADKLGIKTPSLYNHLDGLDDLYAGLVDLGMERLGEFLRDSAIGISKEEALEAVAYSYRQFVKENPELYKAIMKSPKLDTIDNIHDIKSVFEIMHKILEPYKYSTEDEMHIIRGFRSIVHGFASLENDGFFKGHADLEESFRLLVLSFISNIKNNQYL
jgi:AcrR family transcriptional regulator